MIILIALLVMVLESVIDAKELGSINLDNAYFSTKVVKGGYCGTVSFFTQFSC